MEDQRDLLQRVGVALEVFVDARGVSLVLFAVDDLGFVAAEHAVFRAILGLETEHAIADAGLFVERSDLIRIGAAVVTAGEVPHAERGSRAMFAGVGREDAVGGAPGESTVITRCHSGQVDIHG